MSSQWPPTFGHIHMQCGLLTLQTFLFPPDHRLCMFLLKYKLFSEKKSIKLYSVEYGRQQAAY